MGIYLPGYVEYFEILFFTRLLLPALPVRSDLPPICIFFAHPKCHLIPVRLVLLLLLRLLLAPPDLLGRLLPLLLLLPYRLAALHPRHKPEKTEIREEKSGIR